MAAAASAATRWASAATVVSPGAAWPAPSSATSASSLSRRRADTVTEPPRTATARASAAPIPDDAPTTSTRRPSMSLLTPAKVVDERLRDGQFDVRMLAR